MFLLIDTASNPHFIALACASKFTDKGGEILKFKEWPQSLGSAEKIFNSADDLDIDSGKIGGVVVFTGPGSYTGLRVGVSYANAFAYALKVPVVGIDGFEILETQNLPPPVGGAPQQRWKPKTQNRVPILILDNIRDLVYVKKGKEYSVANIDQLLTTSHQPQARDCAGMLFDKEKIAQAEKVFQSFTNIEMSAVEKREVFSKLATEKLRNKKYELPKVVPLYIAKPNIT